MEDYTKLKSRHIAITLCLVILALVAGIYIGYKNSFISGELSSASSSEIPEDLQKRDAFEQFYKVWSLMEQKHIHGLETASEEKMWGAIEGLVDSLEDPYSVFLPPTENENFNIDLRGEFSGVGMEVGLREDGLTVIAPLKGSPAEKAGMMAGDLILKIDDTITSGLDVDAAVDLIRGEKGTSVIVTILREGEESSREITIVRDTVRIPVIETEYRAKEDVFIIRLFSFNESSEQKFEDALTEFADSDADNLIVDFRNNPGGFLSAAIDISSWFLPEGETVVIERGREEKYNKEYTSGGHFLSGEYEMAILVNGGSASASEIVAGALQEHGRAKLVGTQTYGKGSVQELIKMKDDTALKLTVAEWLTPGGLSISKEGLTPDVVIELDADKLEKNGIDTQLEEAIKILK